MSNVVRGLVLVFVLAHAAACGGESTRQKTLKASLVALDAARDGFIVWDKDTQAQIVDKATTYEEGITNLATHRDRREPVVEGFEIAYRMLAVAAFTPNAANAIGVYVQMVDLWGRIKDLTGEAPADPPKPQ